MLQYMIDQVNKAELFTDPFPHLKFTGFFSDETYAGIIDNFPTKDKEYMRSLSSMYKNRYVLDLDSKESNSITKVGGKKELEFWMNFRKELLSKDLMECFFEKYKDFLDPKYLKGAYPTARLSVDMKPYSIGAHRDRDDKLVSVMMYTPKENNDEIADNYGTALFIPKDPNMKITDKHYDLDLFEKVDVAEYRVNGFFSWAVLADSFHGVYPMKYDAPRPTIGYFIKNTNNTKGRFNA